MASWKSEGLRTLKLPREAYFEVIFASGFSELEHKDFFEFSSSFKVKIWTFLAFSLSFELRNRFPKVFELILTLFYCFLREKQ